MNRSNNDKPGTKLGLRVDVDTFRGTRTGVPALLDILAGRAVTATFFFCVGPDRMGRHLFRLVRPAFLKKMVRSGAPSLYGWDILIRGTVASGPVIGDRLGHVIRRTAAEGHEIGLHAWDHYAWQTGITAMSRAGIRQSLAGGMESLASLTGCHPVSTAAPAWLCPDAALLEKDRLPVRFNSDCRGTEVFYPRVGGRTLEKPQIPVTLPTYDEIIGRQGVTDATYNDILLSRIRPGRLNVLTIHAEVEGIRCRELFTSFLDQAALRGIDILPLGGLLTHFPPGPGAPLVSGVVPGREGHVSIQGSPVPVEPADRRRLKP